MGSTYADYPSLGIVYSHAHAYAMCDATRLGSLCDLDEEMLLRCGKRWRVQSLYADPLSLMSAEKPEIVSVCTPTDTHCDVAMSVLAHAGLRAVLMEKPLAITLEDAKRIVQFARERNVVLAVNHSRRYATNHRRVRDLIQAREIGTVLSVSGAYSGGVLHTGTHWFDLARFMVGEIAGVSGELLDEKHLADPTVSVHLDFQCGATGFLRACDGLRGPVFEMDILASEGRIRLLDGGRTIEVYRSGSPGHDKEMRLDRTDTEGFGNVTLNAVQDLVKCIGQDRRPICTGEDGYEAVRCALMARDTALGASSKRGMHRL